MTVPQLLADLQRLLDEYDASRDPTHLLAPRVVGDAQRLVDLTRADVEEHAVALAAVGRLHWHRYLLLPEPDDREELDAALGLFALIISSRPDLVPPAARRSLATEKAGDVGGNPQLWETLARDYLAEYRTNDDLESLDTAIAAFRRACSADAGRCARLRTDLGLALLIRYKATRGAKDLDEAIARLQPEVTDSGQVSPSAEVLVPLFAALVHRYELACDADALTMAIDTGRMALTVLGDDDAARTDLQYRFGFLMNERYRVTRSVEHLDEAIEVLDEAVRKRIAEDENLPWALTTLSTLMYSRFTHARRIEDLDDVVRVARHAAASVEPDHPLYGECLSNLTVALYRRFTHIEDPEDLAAALEVGLTVVRHTEQDDPRRAERMSNLGLILLKRYEQSGTRSDLAEAVNVNRAAVAGITPDDDSFAALATNLSIALMAIHEAENRPEDLNEAAHWLRMAIAATPVGHVDRAARLSNLGLALRARFVRTGAADDLNEAVALSREALDQTPVGHPDRAQFLSNLGLVLRARFERTGAATDLEEAIAVLRHGSAATPAGHVDRAARLSNLGLVLRARFEHTGDPAALEEAVAVGTEALAQTSVGHPDRAQFLSNLGLALRARFEHTGDPAPLREAVAIGRQAVDSTPADHPDRADRLLNLGGTLLALPDSWHEAVAAMREAALQATSRASVRAVAAMHWGQGAAERGDWEEALDAYALAVDLVTKMTPRTLARSDLEFHLSGFRGLTSDALACALQTGASARALQLWEQGRGVLLGQALDTRTDLSDVASHDPELAERFTAIRRALNETSSLPGAAEQRVELARDFDQVVHEIRALPGFADFMRPPRVDDLLRAAGTGPVVLLNVSRFRSDALLLTPDDLRIVSLPNATPESVHAHTMRFREAVRNLTSVASFQERISAEKQISETLAWLWHAVTEPVLSHLNLPQRRTNSETMPHLWWCPSGELTFLPLHAARHDTMNGDPRSVLDLVVSSYIPTVRTLLHARGRTTRIDHADRLSVVAMAVTPETDDLPGATMEADLLVNRFPTRVEVLSSQDATPEAVLGAIAGSPWVHFACHGVAEPRDPASSYLRLAHGKRLTVHSILRGEPVQAELAYLSACATAASGEALPDEAIHLASAFHLVGYRHVIGTLWPVDDESAAKVAALFYAAVADDGHLNSNRAAVALHHAVRQMRDTYPDRPSRWAAHIHVGA